MTEPTIGRTEQEQSERGYPYIVRRAPKPVPAVDINAAPASCALINLEWLSHILGAINALNQPDAWAGTESEVYSAQQQIERLMAQMTDVCESIGGETMQFRQTGCTLEASTDGVLWTVVFDASCATPEPVQYRQNGCVFEVSTNGGSSWTPVFDASCATPEPIDFSQVDCTLTADGVTIFDASCATPDGFQPEPVIEGAIPARDNYCAGVKRLVDYIWSTSQVLRNQWDQSAENVEFFVSAMTAGLSELTPVANVIIDFAFWFVDNQLSGLDTFLADINLREQFECDLYCLVKENNGFNETAWESWLTEFPAVSTRTLPTFTPQQFVGSVAKLLITFTYASKQFAIGTLNSDASCEATCIECAETVWFRDLLSEGCNLSQYVQLIEGVVVDEGGPNMLLEAAVIDSTLSRLQFVIDVSQFASALWRIQPFEFRSKGTGATGNRVARIEAFRFNLWTPVFKGGYEDVVNVSNIANQPFGPFKVSGRIPMPFDTDRIRVTLEGWGTSGATQARISGLQVDGRGVNPFEIECPI